MNSLAATISKARPDLLSEQKGGAPIPSDPPSGVLEKQIPQVEDIGQPTTACFFTRTNTDPTNW